MKLYSFRTSILPHLFVLAFLLLVGHSVFSQAGTVDSSFGVNGSLAYPWSGGAFTVMQDGKILIASSYFDQPNNRIVTILKRFISNGIADNSFGLNGAVITDVNADPVQIKIYPDGKIIILARGNDSTLVLKRLPDGKPDPGFGSNGKTVLPFLLSQVVISDMELQPNGKVLLAGGQTYGLYNGDQSFFMSRLNADGSTDMNFGNTGVVTTIFNVHYDSPELGNYHNDIAAIRDIQLQADGKIVGVGGVAVWVNGSSNDSIAVVRYNSDGQEDTGFAVNGRLTLVPVPSINEGYPSYAASGHSLVIQPDGKLVIGASCYYQPSHGVWFNSYLNVTRLNIEGKLDTSFSHDGMAFSNAAPYGSFLRVALQADSKIFVCTTTGTGRDAELSNNLIFARLLPDGSTDNSFGEHSEPLYSIDNYNTHDYLYGMELASGRIYASGSFGQNVMSVWAFNNNAVDLNPKTISLCPGSTAAAITADVNGIHYQWQQSTDSIHFQNISNSQNFSGVNGATLQLNNISAAWNGYQFRCVADSTTGNTTSIHLGGNNEAEWTGAVSSVWEDGDNWLCGQTPVGTTDVIISKGNVTINSNIIVHSLHVKPGASVKVNTGYTLQVLH